MNYFFWVCVANGSWTYEFRTKLSLCRHKVLIWWVFKEVRSFFGQRKTKSETWEATREYLKVQTCLTTAERKWNFFVVDHNFLVYFRVRDDGRKHFLVSSSCSIHALIGCHRWFVKCQPQIKLASTSWSVMKKHTMRDQIIRYSNSEK